MINGKATSGALAVTPSAAGMHAMMRHAKVLSRCHLSCICTISVPTHSILQYTIYCHCTDIMRPAPTSPYWLKQSLIWSSVRFSVSPPTYKTLSWGVCGPISLCLGSANDTVSCRSPILHMHVREGAATSQQYLEVTLHAVRHIEAKVVLFSMTVP